MYIYTNIHTYIYIYIQTNTYLYIYTYIFIHIRTYSGKVHRLTQSLAIIEFLDEIYPSGIALNQSVIYMYMYIYIHTYIHIYMS
jgi:hypothetical protein